MSYYCADRLIQCQSSTASWAQIYTQKAGWQRLFAKDGPSGPAALSPQGRFATVFDPPTLVDVNTWRTTDLPVRPKQVFDDGRVWGYSEPDRAWGFWSSGRFEPVPVPGNLIHYVLSSDSRSLAYQTWHGYQPATLELGLIDLRTASSRTLGLFEQPIATAPAEIEVNHDGSAVYALLPGSARRLVRLSPRRDPATITVDGEEITAFALATRADHLFIVTGSNRIVRVDPVSKELTTVIPRTPTYAIADGVVPGSWMRLTGAGLAPVEAVASAVPLPFVLGGISIRLNGTPAPLFRVSPKTIWLQVPWELLPGDSPLELAWSPTSPFRQRLGFTPVYASYPRFVMGYDLDQASSGAIAVHERFDGLVTREHPAKPGEVIHHYMVGLGPVLKPPPTGHPASTTTLSPATVAPNCSAQSQTASVPVTVVFAGLAPGTVGFYQLSVRLPEMVPGVPFVGGVGLTCEHRGSPATAFVWLSPEP